MARKPRKYGETGVYHVILRGNNQEIIFYNDADRIFFLKKLEKYTAELNISMYSYCLMDNHIHLLIGNGNKSMPLLIKKIACSYVYYFNHKYNRTGHLFQGRYKSEPVETIEYFKTVYRYILQNPEKAGVCDFRNYRWSSFFPSEFNIKLIKRDFITSIFTSDTEELRFLNYRSNDLCMEYYSQKFSDDEIKSQLIMQIFQIENPSTLKNIAPNELNTKLKYLKKLGIPVNQISRITGINKYIIQKA